MAAAAARGATTAAAGCLESPSSRGPPPAGPTVPPLLLLRPPPPPPPRALLAAALAAARQTEARHGPRRRLLLGGGGPPSASGWCGVVSFLVGALNLAVLLLGLYLIDAVLPQGCAGGLAFAAAPALAGVRVLTMVGAARAQHATADAIASRHLHECDSSVAADRRCSSRDQDVRYKRWLWWTRFGMAVGALQLVAAIYLMFVIVRDISKERRSTSCFFGMKLIGSQGEHLLLCSLSFPGLWSLSQCFTGSDILRWRSFYATHDMAWKAHYREVFDHGIREALCCLGRAKYLTVLEEDEVYSVARLLGDFGRISCFWNWTFGTHS
ncbi:hypothetical protein ACP4OV_031908, partial [Aristida adscensionis]